MQVAFPDEFLVLSPRRRRHLRPSGAFLAHFIKGRSHLDSSDSLLLADFLEVAFGRHLHFLLVLGRLQPELLPYRVTVAVLGKIFKLTLCPNLLMQPLRPGLVLVVVTYHYCLVIFSQLYLFKQSKNTN